MTLPERVELPVEIRTWGSAISVWRFRIFVDDSAEANYVTFWAVRLAFAGFSLRVDLPVFRFFRITRQ